MKSYLILIIFLLSVIFTGFLFVLNNRKSNPVTPKISENEIYFRKKNEELNQKLSGKSIDNPICMDSLHNSFYLSDLVKGERALIFHFSEYNCSVCYESEIQTLQTCFVDNTNSVIILCSYGEYHKFIVFLKTNQIRFPIYRIEHGVMKWELDNYDYPYYFVLHSDLTVSDIHIPDESYPESNKQYLEGVKRYLSE